MSAASCLSLGSMWRRRASPAYWSDCTCRVPGVASRLRVTYLWLSKCMPMRPDKNSFATLLRVRMPWGIKPSSRRRLHLYVLAGLGDALPQPHPRRWWPGSMCLVPSLLEVGVCCVCVGTLGCGPCVDSHTSATMSCYLFAMPTQQQFITKCRKYAMTHSNAMGK